jgi:flagellar motility protein MotE (MotC chaperone)
MKTRLAIALLLGMLVGSAGAAAFAQATDAAAARRAAGSGLQDLAGRLNARERAIERREASLVDREADLREAEARLKDRLDELAAVRAELDEKLASLDAQEEERRVGLVKMTEKMRPKEAAPFFGELDDALAVDILDRMSTSKAGKVLAAMPPDRAARLAEMLTAPVKLDKP